MVCWWQGEVGVLRGEHGWGGLYQSYNEGGQCEPLVCLVYILSPSTLSLGRPRSGLSHLCLLSIASIARQPVSRLRWQVGLSLPRKTAGPGVFHLWPGPGGDCNM